MKKILNVDIKNLFLTIGLVAASFLLDSCGGQSSASTDVSAQDQPVVEGEIEKPELVLGFIKLTDMAPLAIAKEKGFFEEEGLYVRLEAQANWKVLLDRVISGELDGAHMLAGQPIGATVGFGTSAEVVTPFSMD